MTGPVGADLDELVELRRVLGRRADDVADGAAAIGWSVDRVRAAGPLEVPPLPPHRVRGQELAARLDELGRRVERARAALEAADRWAGTSAVLWGLERKGERDAAVDGWHGTATALAAARRRVLGGAAPDLSWLAGASAAEQYAATVADVRHVVGRGPGSHRATQQAMGRWAAHLDRFRASRAGSVTRLGGRALGVVGVVGGALDTWDAVRAGDEERAWTSGLGTAAGVAMLSGFPPLQVAGAVVTGGLLVLEHRDELAGAARAVGATVSEAASAAADFLHRGLF